MSLADELTSSEFKKRNPTEEWVQEFRKGMSAGDKKTWDAWVSDPGKPPAAIIRVMLNHGFPGGRTSAGSWIRKQRGVL